MFRAVSSYLLFSEEICSYYAHQEGCSDIRPRHRVKAALATIDFLVILTLFLVAPVKLPLSRSFNLIDHPRLFHQILLFVTYMSLTTFFVWLLGKLNVYLFGIVSLLIWSLGIFVIFFTTP